jgi:hypothetical protein
MMIKQLGGPAASHHTSASLRHTGASNLCLLGLLFAFACCLSVAAHGQGLASYWIRNDKSEHVFFVGTDQQIHEMYHNSGGWHHGSTGAPLNALTVTPQSPLVGFFDGNIQHVFYVATIPNSNNTTSLQELYNDGTWHVGSPQNAAPSGQTPDNFVLTSGGAKFGDWYPYGLTGFWDGTTEHVFAVTYVGLRMSEYYYNKGSWHFHFLNTSLITRPPSPWVPMTSFYDFTQNVEHVFYIGETGDPKTQHLYELYYNGNWWPNDLTATGAPAPTGNGFTWGLMSFSDGTTEHVFYTTINGNLIEMAHNATGGSWTNSTVPTPSAAGALTGFDDGSFQHVFYLGFDVRVQEMYRAGATGSWQTNDLTARTRAPLASCGVTSFFDGSVEHVFYVGDDSHVHELYYNGNWNHNDLTRLTGALNAQACPRPNGNSQ